LLAVSNMATLGHQLSQRMAALGRVIPPDCQPLVADLEDRFARVAGVADGQIRYLQGVIEFYKARFPHLAVVVAAMLVISAVLLRWPSDRDGGSRLPGRAGRAPDFDLVLPSFPAWSARSTTRSMF
jgi:hypothetical protein